MPSKPIKKVSRHVPKPVQNLLWGKAAGFCQFKGCDKPVWKHPVTKKQLNIAEKAHIYAFSEGGERYSSNIKEENLNECDNLLLLCTECHTQIDEADGEVNWPVLTLKKWKKDHEARVERLMKISPSKNAEVVLYSAAIGDVSATVNYEEAAAALVKAGKYPSADKPTDIQSPSTHLRDADIFFSKFFESDLVQRFEKQVRPSLQESNSSPVALYGLAPQPLLIRLGTLFTDIHNVDVFQFHRDPKGWEWPEKKLTLTPIIHSPKVTHLPPVLIISLTAKVIRDRVTSVLEGQHSIWELTIPEPSHHCIRSKKDLEEFAKTAQSLIEEINGCSNLDIPLKIFPVSPNSPMIELGRIRQAKAHKPWVVYDQHHSQKGFFETLTIT